jgi:predicted DNA-binding transcriptional regulator AlpA
MDHRPSLITAEEVAEIIGRPRHVVYRLTREKLIPSVHLGVRSYAYDPVAIEKWIARGGAREAPPTETCEVRG